jgi:nucleoside-triphosphatase THEP1
MNIAYTLAPGRGDTDLLLFRVAQKLINQGLKVCGTVQINTEREPEHPCDMDIQVLPNVSIIRISQSLGAGSRGCRLDPDALEKAVALVETELTANTDVLIINKFGKHEAEGRGFRNIIATALSEDIPVLVGLNSLNLPAFKEFTGGIEIKLQPDEEKIHGWISSTIQDRAKYIS